MSITKEQIIIELFFPQFKQAITSRFIELFSIQKQTESNNYYAKLCIRYEIHIDDILIGKDKRTSLFIKNLPKFMTKGKLVKLLSDVGNINFLFIPYSKDSQECLGFAYINMINYKNVINVFKKLNGLILSVKPRNFPLVVLYSKFQGKKELSKMFGGKKG